jgi:hypothetical protein
MCVKDMHAFVRRFPIGLQYHHQKRTRMEKELAEALVYLYENASYWENMNTI